MLEHKFAVNAFSVLQINSGPKVARWHSKEPCSGTQGVNMASHKFTVLNTRSKMILEVYLSACNIELIESAHFKYGVYNLWRFNIR